MHGSFCLFCHAAAHLYRFNGPRNIKVYKMACTLYVWPDQPAYQPSLISVCWAQGSNVTWKTKTDQTAWMHSLSVFAVSTCLQVISNASAHNVSVIRRKPQVQPKMFLLFPENWKSNPKFLSGKKTFQKCNLPDLNFIWVS